MQIERPDGRLLYLKTLSQSQTYDGLLEGFPTSEMNKRQVDSLKSDGCVVVHAVEVPIDIGRRYLFGTPATLGVIQCVARFESQGFTHTILYRSSCTVAWFQDSWAMPVDPVVLEKLAQLDWEASAEEWEV